MKHWRDIPGWWEDEWLFQMIVDEAPNCAVFVEVGSWMGRSTACMGQAILASGKQIQLYAIDTWEGSPYGSHPEKIAALQAEGKTLFGEFSRNMLASECVDFVCPVARESRFAARSFKVASVHSVFIDADHRANAVEQDIRSWLPKIVPGGIICGHDWPSSDRAPDGVKKGVIAALGIEPENRGMVWWHRIPQ
jgi:hypothetical protein